jgi:hypothetical protein
MLIAAQRFSSSPNSCGDSLNDSNSSVGLHISLGNRCKTFGRPFPFCYPNAYQVSRENGGVSDVAGLSCLPFSILKQEIVDAQSSLFTVFHVGRLCYSGCSCAPQLAK